jgi:hypothetical protein
VKLCLRHWGIVINFSRVGIGEKLSASLCLLIDFQTGDLYQEDQGLLNSTRGLAGPITFQPGADAVLGHGSAFIG